jgi:hypothetical protein
MDKAIALYLLGMVNAAVVIGLEVEGDVTIGGSIDLETVGGTMAKGEVIGKITEHLV